MNENIDMDKEGTHEWMPNQDNLIIPEEYDRNYMLDEVLKFHNAGWYMIKVQDLWGDKGGKRPIGIWSKSSKNQFGEILTEYIGWRDENAIRRDFAIADWNAGVLTGVHAGIQRRLIGFDIDGKNGGRGPESMDRAWTRLNDEAKALIKDTFWQRSGSGYNHFFLELAPGLPGPEKPDGSPQRNTKAGLDGSIEIRWTGVQTLISGSKTTSGLYGRYGEPEDVLMIPDLATYNNIMKAFTSMNDESAPIKIHHGGIAGEVAAIETATTDKLKIGISGAGSDAVGRNDSMMREVGRLANKGLEKEDARSEIYLWAEKNLEYGPNETPEQFRREIDSTFHSSWGKWAEPTIADKEQAKTNVIANRHLKPHKYDEDYLHYNPLGRYVRWLTKTEEVEFKLDGKTYKRTQAYTPVSASVFYDSMNAFFGMGLHPDTHLALGTSKHYATNYIVVIGEGGGGKDSAIDAAMDAWETINPGLFYEDEVKDADGKVSNKWRNITRSMGSPQWLVHYLRWASGKAYGVLAVFSEFGIVLKGQNAGGHYLEILREAYNGKSVENNTIGRKNISADNPRLSAIFLDTPSNLLGTHGSLFESAKGSGDFRRMSFSLADDLRHVKNKEGLDESEQRMKLSNISKLYQHAYKHRKVWLMGEAKDYYEAIILPALEKALKGTGAIVGGSLNRSDSKLLKFALQEHLIDGSNHTKDGLMFTCDFNEPSLITRTDLDRALVRQIKHIKDAVQLMKTLTSKEENVLSFLSTAEHMDGHGQKILKLSSRTNVQRVGGLSNEEPGVVNAIANKLITLGLIGIEDKNGNTVAAGETKPEYWRLID